MIAFMYFSSDFLEITSVTDSGWCQCPVLPALVQGEHWGWQNGNGLGDTDIFGQSQLPQHWVTAAEQPLRSVLLPPALPAVWQSSRRDSQSIQELSPTEALICQAYPCSVALQLKAFLVFGSLDIWKTWRKMQAEFTAELGRGKKGTYEVPREDGNSKWKIKRKDEAGPLV